MIANTTQITVTAMKVLMSSALQAENKFYLVESVARILNRNQHALYRRYGQQVTGAVVV